MNPVVPKSLTRSGASAGLDRTADSPQSVPVRLKLAASFEPCPIEGGDEVFSNGIFNFNISRLTLFIEAHTDRFPVEAAEVASTTHYDDSRLDQATVAAANLSRPVLFVEIAPGRFNLIDGNHRMARARREGLSTVPAYRISCPHHVPFLTSMTAYQKYVDYWNGKIQEMQPIRRRASSRSRATEPANQPG